MWLVVGLGNPGQKYENSRHNIGFIIVDALAAGSSVKIKNKTESYAYGRGVIGGEEALLIKPLTFMNRSGGAVKSALARFSGIDKIIVIHDDLDLAKGVIRIKESGSSGGHKGIGSIMDALGTGDFIRLRIGIGRPARIPVEDYVLRPFPKSESRMLRETVEKAVSAFKAVLIKGVSSAQNEYHRD
ncbi:MAG: aminoacyl-tRNA hydrolase [Nitrospirae bacterium]|nr:aminoacyl-tRNA hydrolase [Nitrospirota bacterium]